MKTIVRIGVLFLFFFSQQAKAQMPALTAEGAVIIQKPGATWSITPFADNILKVQVNPKGYQTTENISDAVMIQPTKTSVKVSSMKGADYVVTWPYMQMQVKGDTMSFGDGEIVLAGMHQSGEYNGFRFILQSDEKVFGGGERALPLNRRGYRFNLYNSPWYGYGVGADNLNYSVPFFTSSLHYGLFFDNVSKGYADIGKTQSNIFEYGAVSGQLNFYIISGETYAEILCSYHQLTGTQPLPPRWAMGNFLSRFGYVSEADVKGIMSKMKQYDIPFDAVIFDLFWFGDSIKNTLGNLDWVNKKAWPNPTKMIADFKKEGTQTILITEPYVLQASSNYNKSKQFHAVDSIGKPYVMKEFYFGDGGLIDIFREDARNWFWSKYKLQMNKGVAGWWGDLGEPETHPANMYHNLRDLGYKRLFKAAEVHNAYGHYWTKMLYDKHAVEYPNMRLFSLNRSGFAGTQRYSIFPWSGDVSRSWDGLRAQLPVMLGMSMSGVPYIHADAGGFADKGGDPELYVRWLQFAQFTPIFRPHGAELNKVDTVAGGYPSEPALFDEPYRSLAKHVVEERYALLPYNYTLAYEQAVNAKPLVSPLYYHYENDTAAYRAEDEFMWGESILVAPVLQKGATSRKLYLPAGNWYDWKTFAKHTGSSWRTDSVSMSSIPVYIKEGSFIPYMGKVVKNTQQYNTANVMITYMPSANASSYVLYDDDGKSKNALAKKSFELITFESNGWKDSCTFRVSTNKGAFVGRPATRMLTLAIPAIEKLPSKIMINGKQIAQQQSGSEPYVSWDENMRAAFIHFVFKSDTITIQVVL
jgi:oligosaccharide 4-alpha-D-glucosyltransferase